MADHGSEGARSYYATRTLEAVFPELVDYLSPGIGVLDVGCGPGTITLDVAGIVAPGKVRGIDRESSSIEQARIYQRERRVTNLSFEVADALRLPYEDDQFDLTYSHALLDWVPRPVEALAEQRRVTKPGGWVCARLANDDTAMLYPRYPSLERFRQALRHLADPDHPETFRDGFIGAKVVEIFSRAQLTNLVLKPMQPTLWRSGQEGPMPSYLHVLRRTLTGMHDLRTLRRERLVQSGALDQHTIEEAIAEWKQWASHPWAFHMRLNVFAAAQVGEQIGTSKRLPKRLTG